MRVSVRESRVSDSDGIAATASGLFSKYRGDRYHRENRNFRSFTSGEQMTFDAPPLLGADGERNQPSTPCIDQADVESQINRRRLIYRTCRNTVTMES
ncbi:Uncharacterised protein [Mycobacteroides abscessus subsp. abscessus]|nr:Uncharacterised protein [Mycobacteroides abscessus subsp. abscessus]